MKQMAQDNSYTAPSKSDEQPPDGDKTSNDSIMMMIEEKPVPYSFSLILH